MATIKAFRGYRPAPGLAKDVASLPYDVVSTKEARELAGDNPRSFYHVGRPEIDLPDDVPVHDDRVYEQGRANLYRLIEEGTLVRDDHAQLYLYQQRMDDHVQAGLVCLASVREYENGRIKIHEHTRKEKEDDRTRHVTTQNANAEPVFLTYRGRPGIDHIVDRVRSQKPAYDFVSEDGIAHTVWTIPEEEDVAALVKAFESVEALYVADGHHRTAAAVRHGQAMRAENPGGTGDEPYEFFMAVLFPDDQLQILDYNRVVRDLNGLSVDEFLAGVRERFDVETAHSPKPAKPGTFGMYLEGNWYTLRAKDGTFPKDDPVNRLDAAILQNNLLAPVLGITDPRTDKRIDFVGGVRGIKELVRRCREGEALAFAMYPTSLEQLMAVADAGRVMPPKSTWFEPKLRSGLVVRLIED